MSHNKPADCNSTKNGGPGSTHKRTATPALTRCVMPLPSLLAGEIRCSSQLLHFYQAKYRPATIYNRDALSVLERRCRARIARSWASLAARDTAVGVVAAWRSSRRPVAGRDDLRFPSRGGGRPRCGILRLRPTSREATFFASGGGRPGGGRGPCIENRRLAAGGGGVGGGLGPGPVMGRGGGGRPAAVCVVVAPSLGAVGLGASVDRSSKLLLSSSSSSPSPLSVGNAATGTLSTGGGTVEGAACTASSSPLVDDPSLRSPSPISHDGVRGTPNTLAVVGVRGGDTSSASTCRPRTGDTDGTPRGLAVVGATCAPEPPWSAWMRDGIGAVLRGSNAARVTGGIFSTRLTLAPSALTGKGQTQANTI